MSEARTKRELAAENKRLRDQLAEMEKKTASGPPENASPPDTGRKSQKNGLIFFADGRIAACSPESAAILGYTPDELISFSAKTVSRHIHPDDRMRVLSNIKRRFEGKSVPDRSQYRCLHKDGHVVWLEITTRMTTYRGKPALQAFADDLTKQRHSLIDSEELYRRLMSNPMEGICLSQSGRLIFTNDSLCRMLGYTQKELLGQPTETIIIPDERKRFTERMKETSPRKKSEFRHKSTGLKKNGTHITIEMTVTGPFSYQGKPTLLTTLRDITDHIKSMEKVLISEKNFRILAEKSPSMIFINQMGRLVFTNSLCSEILGYDKEEFQDKSFDFLSLIAPEFRELITANFEKHKKGKEVPAYEYQLVTKEGIHLDAIITTKIIPYHHSPAILGIVTIITEQKNTEKKIRESEALTRGILKSAPLGICLIVDQIFQFVNPALCGITGYKEKELVGSKSILLFPSKAAFKGICDLAQAKLKEGKPGIVETRLRRKDGTLFDVYGTVCRLEPGNPKNGQIVIVEDITQRKQDEVNLKSAKEKYQNLMEMAPDGIIMVDLLGRVTSVNQAFTNLTEYSREELIGKHFTQLPTVLSRDIPRHISLFTSIVKGEMNKPFEFRWKTKNWVVRTGEIRTALIRKNGRVAGLQAIIRDNTEKKEQEAAQKIVYKIAEKAKNVESLDILFQFIHKALAKIMPANDNFYVAIYDDKQKILDFPYFVDEQESNPGPQPLGQGLTEYVLLSGEPLLATPEKLKQLEKEDKIKLVGPPCFDWLGVPMKHDNSTIGVMVVQNYSEGMRFTETHKNLFKFISDQIGSVIERKRAEEETKKNERQYRALFEHGNNAITLFDIDGYLISANRKAADLLGYEVDEMKGMSYQQLVHSQEVMHARSKLHLALKSKPIPKYERRCLRKDGTEFIGEFIVSPVHDEKGNLLFIQSIFRDITEQKRIEKEIKDSRERLRIYAAHLQSAREQERTHIAREIHDELGQFLTALKMDITWMEKRLNADGSELKSKLKDMNDITNHTIQAIKKISTELRPGLIDDLGFTAALEWQAEEFEKRTGIETTFSHPREEIFPDTEQSIALFRIIQEALTNIARHAKATSVAIRMGQSNSHLHVQIQDNGIGVQQKEIDSFKSLGLIGIRERAQLLGGQARIKGKKNEGTNIDILVPLASEGGQS